MTRLNQILAVAKGVKSTTQQQIATLYHGLQKTALFTGLRREYRPNTDDGDRLPSENQLVQLNAGQILHDIQAQMKRLFDIVGTVDASNQVASAPITIDGVELVAEVPATHLLFLEKQLTDLRTVAANVPVLDPAFRWTFDANAGVYCTEPVETVRTVKVQEPLVLYPATDKFPAQTNIVTKDIVAGTWSTQKLSGALRSQDVAALVARIDKAIEAVKKAREEANTVPVVTFSAAAVLNWIFEN